MRSLELKTVFVEAALFESFVILLREGVEAALVIAILLSVLARSGRLDLYRPVYSGIALALVGSVGAAVALETFPVNGEAYEGVLYWVSAAFVGSMLWWMHRRSRELRSSIEGRVATGGAWAVGAFAFLMVFREGAETVLFLAAVRLTTDGLLSLIGAALGLAVAIVFGVMFVRGTLRVDLRRFFLVTECVLVLFVAQLVVNGYHELAEAGFVPATRTVMAWVGPVVKNDALFVLALVALPLFVWVSGSRAPALEGLSDADRRLAIARLRRDRQQRWIGVATAGLILGSVGIAYARERSPDVPGPAEPVAPAGGVVRLPLDRVSDGRLHRFSTSVDGLEVRFLVLATEDGLVRTAFDACEICGAMGYRQDGALLLCLNCQAEIVPATVGQPGGCNPIPLASRIDGAELVIDVAAIGGGAKWFAPAAVER